MFITLDFDSDEPIYVQLYRQIISAIARGELAAGEILPPVRTLAMDLGINMHTVHKVYTMLKQEGYLVSNRQKGMTVAQKMPERDDLFKARITGDMANLISEAICRGADREECSEYFEKAYKLAGGTK